MRYGPNAPEHGPLLWHSLTSSGMRWRSSVMKQIENRHGPLDEVITPLVAEAEAGKRQTVAEHSRTGGSTLLTKSAGGTLY